MVLVIEVAVLAGGWLARTRVGECAGGWVSGWKDGFVGEWVGGVGCIHFKSLQLSLCVVDLIV